MALHSPQNVIAKAKLVAYECNLLRYNYSSNFHLGIFHCTYYCKIRSEKATHEQWEKWSEQRKSNSANMISSVEEKLTDESTRIDHQTRDGLF